MTETTGQAAIRQCEHCFTFLDEQRAPLRPQPRPTLAIPDEVTVCAECAIKGPPEPERFYQSRANRNSKRKTKAFAPAQAVKAEPMVHRGCPPEIELPGAATVQTDLNGRVVDDTITQEEYVAQGEATATNGRILAFLRVHLGRWQSCDEIENRFGTHRMNSRAADIRRYVKAEGLDVDQRQEVQTNGKRYSYYRLCRIEDSERLARKQQREMDDESVHGVPIKGN